MDKFMTREEEIGYDSIDEDREKEFEDDEY
jgi:hypothetical protein